jgi:hypothetical protein
MKKVNFDPHYWNKYCFLFIYKFYLLSFNDPTYHSSSCGGDSNDEEKQTPFHSSKLHPIYAKFYDKTVRRVLKCAIAYLISTLFSLYRPLANKLGPAPFLISTG